MPLPRSLKIVTLLVALAVGAAALWWATPKVMRRTQMQGLKAVTVASGLVNPWSLAFLPDGRMLVTERPGRLRIVWPDGRLGEPLAGLPPVWARGEGGLLDVVLDPGFASNQTLYWSYSEPAGDGGSGSSTAVARARLVANSLQDVRVIYRQSIKLDDAFHFGSRLLFGPDGTLFVSLGDRWHRDDAQSVSSAHGKLVRIDTEGRPPAGNPFAEVDGALPELWTLGHRNIQGLAFHPTTGELWASEHGPQGGDELNLIVAGRNYGWPVITHGCEYTTCAPIGVGTKLAGLEQPVAWWGPKPLAPSGMAFLTSERYPGWKGQMFIGSLTERAVVRLKIEGHQVVEQQRLATALNERIRDVRQGPDGWLYVLTDNPEGRLIRLEN